MTITDLTHRRATRHEHRESRPRLTEKVATFRALVADSVRLDNALQAAPTVDGRKKLTERFVDAHRAA